MKTIDKKQSRSWRKLNYRRFSTSADIGLEVWGRDLPELFHNAIHGLRFLLFGQKVNRITNFEQKGQIHCLQLTAKSYEDLLVKTLEEILFILDHHRKIFIDQDLALDGQKIFCRGILIDNQWQQLLEIKAVTYHNLQLTVKGERYYIKIVFDL